MTFVARSGPQFCEFLIARRSRVMWRTAIRVAVAVGPVISRRGDGGAIQLVPTTPVGPRPTAADRIAYFLERVAALSLVRVLRASHSRTSATGFARQHRFRDPVTHRARSLAMRCAAATSSETPSIVIGRQLAADLGARGAGNLIERFLATGAPADLSRRSIAWGALPATASNLGDGGADRGAGRKAYPAPPAQPTPRLRDHSALRSPIIRLPASNRILLIVRAVSQQDGCRHRCQRVCVGALARAKRGARVLAISREALAASTPAFVCSHAGMLA